MGTRIVVETKAIAPSQDFLKEETIRHILKHVNEPEELPPTPIVRKDGEGYIAIDGHNLLAVADMMEGRCEVYCAESEDDLLPGEGDAIEKRNADLKEKFRKVATLAEEMEREGISAVADLRKKYSYLESRDKAFARFGMRRLVWPVNLIIVDEEDRLLLARRAEATENGKWSIPGGGPMLHESKEEALRREIGEELGCEVVWCKPFRSYTEEFEDRRVVASYYYGQIKGEIKLDDELSAYDWFSLDDPRLDTEPIAFNQRDVLRDFIAFWREEHG